MACLTPPRAAVVMLRMLSPGSDLSMIEGDLLEEYVTIAEPLRAAWYWQQVLRSAPPLLGMQIRQPEWNVALCTFLIYAIPIRILDFLWAFLLSQVPLKEDAIRPFEFLVVHVVLACACAITAQATLSRCNAVWLLLASWLIVFSIPAWLPTWFCWMLIVVPPACSAAFVALRRQTS